VLAVVVTAILGNLLAKGFADFGLAVAKGFATVRMAKGFASSFLHESCSAVTGVIAFQKTWVRREMLNSLDSAD
jgi:hypothetical protein